VQSNIFFKFTMR